MCVEHDATVHGIPEGERYPAFAPIRQVWDSNPWTRAGFGLQWVIEPGGRFLLSTGAKRPFREANQASAFQAVLEQALRRLIAIRSHPRGSPGEAREIERLQRELEGEVEELVRPAYVRTREIFQQGNAVVTRFPGVIGHSDPAVRLQAIELLGSYAAREQDTGFRPGGPWEVFARGVAERLDDELPEIRAVAARTLLTFVDDPGPSRDGREEPEGDRLVALARERWEAALRERGTVPAGGG